MAGPRKSIISLDPGERSGPLFDGEASLVVREWLTETKREVGDIGADWIRIAAMEFDKSGRGGTGRAAAGVTVKQSDANGDVVVFGELVKGEVWWTWLEGDSERNKKSKFKGYHIFRLTRLRLKRYVTPYAQQRLTAFIGRMGGRTI